MTTAVATSASASASAGNSYLLPVHRSRTYAILIDVHKTEATQAVAFWSAALGASPRQVPSEPQFTILHEAVPGLVAAVQAVDDAPRFHIGIETDNVPAETARLLALGAVQVSQWLECRVLRAPGGHLLCVLPVHSDPGNLQCRGKLVALSRVVCGPEPSGLRP